MVRPKQQKKKGKSGHVDFAKIKRKIGRKLPQAKNTTDTAVKSKALILPEQSVASDKRGLAVSGKGLTLKELLHQTSHHNSRVRREAVNGVRDLVLKHPSELKLHWLVIVEKLRERISDDDKTVREALYHLLKSAVFPSFQGDVPTPLVSLLMACVLNAMTRLAVDVRMMAFKFFDLVVDCCPSSFFIHADQVLLHYHDTLRNAHLYSFHDKGKLEVALSGLLRCLSLLTSHYHRGRNTGGEAEQGMPIFLHSFDCTPPVDNASDSRVIGRVEDLIPTLINCFHQTASSARATNNVDNNLYTCMLKALESLNLALKVYYTNAIGKLSADEVTKASTRSQNSLRHLLMRLFEMFPLGQDSKSLSKLTKREEHWVIALNVAIMEIYLYFDEIFGDPLAFIDTRFSIYILEYLSTQVFDSVRAEKEIKEKIASLLLSVPKVLIKVDADTRHNILMSFTVAFQSIRVEPNMILKFLSVMEAMLIPSARQQPWLYEKFESELWEFQVTWGQKLTELLLKLESVHFLISKAVLHLLLRMAQSSSGNFLVSDADVQGNVCLFYHNDGVDTCSSTFSKLPKDCQELAISSLYYCLNLDSTLLRSLVACCLYEDMDYNIICRIVEVVHSTFRAGRVRVEDHVSFFVTLLIKFRVLPENHNLYKDEFSVISKRTSYHALTNMVCSCLCEIGDCSLVLKMVHKTVFCSTHPSSHLDNARGILKMFVILNLSPSEPSDEIISALNYYLWNYMICTASFVLVNDNEPKGSNSARFFRFYSQPALILLTRSKTLLGLLLDVMRSCMKEYDLLQASDDEEFVTEQINQVEKMISVMRFLYEDKKLAQNLSMFREVVMSILQNAQDLLRRNDFGANLLKSLKMKNSLNNLIRQIDAAFLEHQ